MSNNSHSEAQIKKFKLLITIASIAIPLVVAMLFKVKISYFVQNLNFNYQMNWYHYHLW